MGTGMGTGTISPIRDRSAFLSRRDNLPTLDSAPAPAAAPPAPPAPAKEPLVSIHIRTLTSEAEVRSFLDKDAPPGLLLLYSDTCPGCKWLKPHYSAAADAAYAQHAGAAFARINTHTTPVFPLLAEYKISSIPAVLVKSATGSVTLLSQQSRTKDGLVAAAKDAAMPIAVA